MILHDPNASDLRQEILSDIRWYRKIYFNLKMYPRMILDKLEKDYLIDKKTEMSESEIEAYKIEFDKYREENNLQRLTPWNL